MKKINKNWDSVCVLERATHTHASLLSSQYKVLINLRLDRLGERPSLHLGLEPHVVDLQGETVSVHDDDNKVILVSCDVSASAQPPLSLATTSLQPRPR